MLHLNLLLLACACLLRPADSRVNATNALFVFDISDCPTCAADKDSIFCTQAGSDSDFVQNLTTKYTISNKISQYGATNGVKYCWQGE
jgi:hypothetical protein